MKKPQVRDKKIISGFVWNTRDTRKLQPWEKTPSHVEDSPAPGEMVHARDTGDPLNKRPVNRSFLTSVFVPGTWELTVTLTLHDYIHVLYIRCLVHTRAYPATWRRDFLQNPLCTNELLQWNQRIKVRWACWHWLWVTISVKSEYVKKYVM